MGLVDSVLMWWHRAMPVRTPQASVAPPRPSHHRVPREYLTLHTYLDRRYAVTVVMTFTDVEALLGFPLPAAARSEPDWWMAAQHAEAWRATGRTATPNLLACTVTFERHS